MSRSDATQSDVLTAITAALRTALALDARQCFEVLEPLAPPVIPKGGVYFVTVAPGEGVFVDGEQAAGNCTEEWTVIVTAYARVRLDSTDHDQNLLQEASRGLLVLKGKLLAALVGADPVNGEEAFMRDLIFAQRAERPGHDGQKGVAWISIHFGVNFDWDLT